MIQVDIFWSWAFGAQFAACSSGVLKTKNESLYINYVFMYLLMFLSLIFSPSGIYLLWEHPGWESMFVFTSGKDGINPLLPMLFATTNVLFGIYGFKQAATLIKNGEELSSHNCWVDAYTAFAAILGMGYNRFLYAGTYKEWGLVKYSKFDFFHSKIFFTLLCMGVILLPCVWIPVHKWFQHTLKKNKNKKSTIIHYCRGRFLTGFIVISILYSLIVCCFADEQQRQYLSDDDYFRHFGPLVGFFVAQCVVSTLSMLPMICA